MFEGYFENKLLSTGLYSRVYRARQIGDGATVILKVGKSDPPTAEEVASIKHEWQVMQALAGTPSAPRPIRLEEFERGPAIVMEYIASLQLATYLAKIERFTLEEFLHFALAAAAALGDIHRSGVIHKDLNLYNLLYDPELRRCTIVDFSLAIAIDRQPTLCQDARLIEGTLAYISPEQTGHMNRTIDYRSDYYSLGITLYRTLTGKYPFFSNDPLEMVHYHMAKRPPSPSAIDPAIPEVLSSIILKLLMKEPEERYQSIAGICGDLESSLEGLSGGKIAPFPLAAKESRERFYIPEKIYGREKEKEELFSLYESAVAGKSAVALIGGWAGVGKSSLVREMQRPITKREGLFIDGKFEKLKEGIPYFAIAQALSRAMLYFLELPEEEVAEKRALLLAALGHNGELMTRLLPPLERLIGKQPPLLAVGPIEEENRFLYTLRNFIEALPTREKPIVLFLDDLQWADIPSIKLLQMAAEAKIPNLLLIGSYRSNEVAEGHPLFSMVGELKKGEVDLYTLQLEPLSERELLSFVADTLYNSREEAAPLGKVCFEKSKGNPFILIKLLEKFYSSGFIRYGEGEARWHFDIDKIKNCTAGGSAAELMGERISLLEPKLQKLLMAASCLGGEFDVELLESLGEEEDELFRGDLLKLLKERFILSEEKHYYSAKKLRFSHDLIQEGAAGLLQREEALKIHLAIADTLEKRSEMSDEQLFTLASHLNSALERSDGIGEERRREIAKINFLAAKRAKELSAHETALDYFDKTLQWRGGDEWVKEYPFTVELYTSMMESALLAGEFERMEKYGDLIIEKSKSPLDRSKVFKYRGIYNILHHNTDRACDLIIEWAEDLGFTIKKFPSDFQIRWELALTFFKLLFTRTTIEQLTELPEIHDRQLEEFHDLAMSLAVAPVIEGNCNLYALLILKPLQQIVEMGNSSRAPLIYSYFGWLCTAMGFLKTGSRFSKTALQLSEKSSNILIRNQGAMISSLNLSALDDTFDSRYQSLIDSFYAILGTGDCNSSTHCLTIALIYKFLSCKSLNAIKEEFEKYEKVLSRLRNCCPSINLRMSEGIGCASRGGESSAVCQSQVGSYRLNTSQLALGEPQELSPPLEAQPIPSLILKGIYLMILDLMELNNHPTCRLKKIAVIENEVVQTANLMHAYLLRDMAKAADILVKKSPCREAMERAVDKFNYHFYEPLALIALLDKESSPFTARSTRRAIKKSIRLYKKYAKINPGNFLNKSLIQQAEWARANSRNRRAMRLYDQAVEQSQLNGFPGEEALALELAARFYIDNESEKRGAIYLKEAIRKWSEWGAYKKVSLLEKEFEPLLEKNRAAKERGEGEKIGEVKQFDIGSVQKSSESISSTILMDELLLKVMKIAMEQTEAEKGVLLLESKGQYTIAAESRREWGETKILHGKEATGKELPEAILRQTFRNFEMITAGEASEHPLLKNDPYVQEKGVRSLLAMPLVNRERVTAILYLENNLAKNAFTEERYGLLIFLSSQLAMAIDNAELYKETSELNQELKTLNSSYERFIPKDFLSLIGKESVADLHPGDYIEREMSVLFMDIPSFASSNYE